MIRLDSRTWLVWGLAAMLPLLLGRNPWLSIEVLLIVTVVRMTRSHEGSAHRMQWFLRMAAIMASIGVVFNLLTVHAGNLVFATLPDAWPVIGGNLTWNAVAYGLVSAVTLFGLVLTGITVAGLIRWVEFFRVLPPSLSAIAVTGSVAWVFLPQTAIAWTNIREAMTMRGHRFRGARDFVPIVVPLLASGLERSLTMAEALESRGFGATEARPGQRHGGVATTATTIAGMMLVAFGAYSVAIGRIWIGLTTAILGIGGIMLVGRIKPRPMPRATAYRIARLRKADGLVITASAIVMVTVVTAAIVRPEVLAFSAYPTMTMPEAQPLVMSIVSLLLAPALLSMPPSDPS